MIQEIMKLLLAVNRLSTTTKSCVSYNLRISANYDLTNDGVRWHFKLVGHQSNPKKDLETLSFENAAKIYDHLLGLAKYWKQKCLAKGKE